MTDRHPQILNASTNLLGICFAIITGLKVTGSNPKSYADEIAWCAVAPELSRRCDVARCLGLRGGRVSLTSGLRR